MLPALATLALVAPSPVTSAAGRIDLDLNGSDYFETHADIKRVHIGSPEIADVTKIDKQHLLIIGKGTGSTTLIVWTEDGMMQDFEVSVSEDDSYIARRLENLINLPHVKVTKVGKNVMLSGWVDYQREKDLAEKTALFYVGGKSSTQVESSDDEDIESGDDVKKIYTINNGQSKDIEGVYNTIEVRHPIQVQLEAKIIELNLTDAKSIGLQYGSPTTVTDVDSQSVSVSSTSSDGNGNSTTASSEGVVPLTRSVEFTSGLFFGGESFSGMHHTGSWIIDHIARVDATINALVSKGNAQILSRPNTVTLSGKEAGIHIGGQIPVVVTNTNGSSSTQWKDFGIKLKIKPEVDSEGVITANVYAGVSSLDYSNSVSVPNSDGTLPSIATREATATVNIPPDMTMAIGGLLTNDDTKTVTKFPILGDIPIIGEFFRHTQRSKLKRELIVLITPRIITPTTPVLMGDKMKEKYDQIAKDDEKRTKVNLNPTPEVKPPEEEKANESLIEKYLDRKALPKPDKR